MFLEKGVLKIYSKFTGEHPCRSVISNKFRHGYSPVNLLHIFRTPFGKNTSGWLLLAFISLKLTLSEFTKTSLSHNLRLGHTFPKIPNLL